MVVGQPDNMEAIDVERDYSVHGKNKLQIEEKLTEIANILGISMEGSVRELRWFVHEMMAEEKDKCKADNQSTKKSKVQRELEKLAFSVNYNRPSRDSLNGVKLLKL